MAKAWFLMLCRNEGDGEACALTKALMRDCKATGAKPTAAYHRVGERDFPSANAPCTKWTSSRGSPAGT